MWKASNSVRYGRLRAREFVPGLSLQDKVDLENAAQVQVVCAQRAEQKAEDIQHAVSGATPTRPRSWHLG
jgi:hypothetical protein